MSASSDPAAEPDGRSVPCELLLGRTVLPVEIPAEMLAWTRLADARDVMLRVPGYAPAQRPPTERDRRTADQWRTEAADFDRF
ncbi:MAG: hypothetical protein KY476_21395 [Planctomycetes bacterium]|nr:hypothetical protein [Planctomycetota bacterium]